MTSRRGACRRSGDQAQASRRRASPRKSGDRSPAGDEAPAAPRPPPELPDRTRTVAWQWEAVLLPLPEHDRVGIAQRIADGAMDIPRPSSAFRDFDVAIGVDGDSILRVQGGEPPDAFLLEVNRGRISYRHECAGGGDPAGHIRGVASPLLRRIAGDEVISRRLISAGSAYELTSSVPGPGRPDCRLLATRLATGLAERPWEADQGPPRALERLDVHWAVETRLLGERAVLEFRLGCPRAGDARPRIDATVVARSAADEIPSPAWAGRADQMHDVVWPEVLALAAWLLTPAAPPGAEVG